MPRDGVTAYLLHRPNVQIAFAGERESIVQRLLREPDRAYLLAARGAPVYYVLSDAPNGEQERLFRALNPAATVVLDIPKPGDHSRFKLYRLAPALPADDVWLEPPAAVGDVVRLLGYRLEARAARPGDRLRLTLYWEATGRPSKDYTVFNHVVDRTERIWGQKDGQPAGGARPTHEWRPGDVVGDTHELVIAPDAPPGQYTVITGLYELRTLQRLAVQTGDQPASNSVALGSITILPP
jgi:hypothetical protein